MYPSASNNNSVAANNDGTVLLYVVDEREDHPGTVSCLLLSTSTGLLTPHGPTIIAADDRPTEGGACCHVMVTPDQQYVLAANYGCGSLVAIGRDETTGMLKEDEVYYYRLPPAEANIEYPGHNEKRQERAHAHQVVYSKGTESDCILVPDLGSDVVWSVPYLGRPSSDDGETNRTGPLGTPVCVPTPSALMGGGPRHLVLHPNPAVKKVYVTYELTSLVACWNLDEKTGAISSPSCCGEIRVCNVLDGTVGNSLFSDDSNGTNSGDAAKYAHLLHESDESGGDDAAVQLCSDSETSTAAIRITPTGSHVLISSRLVGAEGAVSAIPLSPEGDLPLKTTNKKGPAKIRGTIGHSVRDFVVCALGADGEDAIMAANQDTDEIVLLREGMKAEVITKNVPTPVCLCVVENYF